MRSRFNFSRRGDDGKPSALRVTRFVPFMSVLIDLPSAFPLLGVKRQTFCFCMLMPSHAAKLPLSSYTLYKVTSVCVLVRGSATCGSWAACESLKFWGFFKHFLRLSFSHHKSFVYFFLNLSKPVKYDVTFLNVWLFLAARVSLAAQDVCIYQLSFCRVVYTRRLGGSSCLCSDRTGCNVGCDLLTVW